MVMRQRRNKKLSCVLLVALVLVMMSVNVSASCTDGIRNNGTGGIGIDINAAPFTTFATYSWGQYAYTSSGCAWYASARVNQLTGKGNTIWSGSSWYNSAYSSCGFSRGTEVRAPAIVCWSGHVAILEKIDGGTAYLSEGGVGSYRNWGTWKNDSNASNGYCVIHAIEVSEVTTWCGTRSDYLGCVYLPSAPAPDTSAPTVSNVKISDVTSEGYTVTCTVSDNVDVTSVKCPSWNSDMHIGDDAVWLQANVSGGTATCRVNIAKLKSGAVSGHYTTHIYAYDAAGNKRGVELNAVYIDTSAPTVSNVKISDVSSSGYTVTCTVSDNVGVTSVECPSWNSDMHNGGDAVWLPANVSGGTATCRVNIAKLKSGAVSGHYMTHIYAYDAAGNKRVVTLNAVYVKTDTEAPTISNVKISDETSNGYTVTCTVSDNVGVTDVKFATKEMSEAQFISYKGSCTGAGSYEFVFSDGVVGKSYTTQIYAYDKDGNYTCYKLGYYIKLGDAAVSGEDQTTTQPNTIEEDEEDYDEDEMEYDDSDNQKPAPGKLKKVSAKPKANRSIRVTWKKGKNVSGYQLQYSTNRSFSKKTTKSMQIGANKATIKKLKKKTYYVRVRAFRYSNTKKAYGQWSMIEKVYGKWSTVKKVKVR